MKFRKRSQPPAPTQPPNTPPSQEDLDTMPMEGIEQIVGEMCEKAGVVMPLEFLVNIQAGKDPRRTGDVFRQLTAIREEFGEDPPPAKSWMWMELCDTIDMQHQQAPVELAQSQNAAKQVAEYIYSKKRNAAITAKATEASSASNLTAEEVVIFSDKFRSRY